VINSLTTLLAALLRIRQLSHSSPCTNNLSRILRNKRRIKARARPNKSTQMQVLLYRHNQYVSTLSSPSYQRSQFILIPSQQSYQQQQYSPPDVTSQTDSTAASRPSIAQSRSYNQHGDDPSMSSNNGSLPTPRPAKAVSNRQSVHNGLSARDNQQQGGGAYVAPPTSGQAFKGNHQVQQQGDVGRVTPQPAQLGEDMTEEDVAQLIKDHKELRMSLPYLLCCDAPG